MIIVRNTKVNIERFFKFSVFGDKRKPQGKFHEDYSWFLARSILTSMFIHLNGSDKDSVLLTLGT